MELTKFKSIFDLLNKFPDEQSCIDYLAERRWNGNVISPFDATSRVYKCKLNRYKCKNTGKYFNAKTGTIFEDTKIPLRKWFVANYIFSSHKKGISSHQLARDLSITQKTAWFMLHRLRVAFGEKSPLLLKGVIEADETMIKGAEANKHESKKTSEGRQGKYSTPDKNIAGAVQRGGKVVTKKIKERNKDEIISFILQNVETDWILCTDEYSGYNDLKTVFIHKTVNHSKKEFVRPGRVHTNTIENYWSVLKRGVYGIYHQISSKHLQAYLDEFSLRYNTREISTSARFDIILGNMATRLKYAQLIANEKEAA